jgi:N-acetylglucosamine-6-phosphate deacetylase
MRTQDQREPAARVLGVHYEGPFVSEKQCGALRTRYFKTFANGNEIADLPKLKTPGAIHLTTLAPEIEGGINLIKELKKQGWTVSIGHTRAEIETLDAACESGARHLTHFYNAMSGLHHRDVGVAGWGLTKDEMTLDIIADNVHVHPEILKFTHGAKGAGKISLISDSVSPTGLGDGEFEIWNEKISVINGKTRNERGSIAGSVITMRDAVNNMLALGIAASEVSQMASQNPARVIGIETEYGSIETGKRADLVALQANGEVRLTIIGGRIAFDSQNDLDI